MIGGLSMTELVIILGLALLLLGPDQLPTIAKSLGKGLRELRKATDDIKSQFEEEMVNFDDAPKRMLAPVPNPPDDPAAARAGARSAAAGAADDPAAARAAARRKAIAPEALTAATVAEAVSAPPLAGAPTSADGQPVADGLSPGAVMDPPAASVPPPAPTPVTQPAAEPSPAAPAGTIARDAKA
jgi:sec-independent protein translocase protein TatB